MGDLVVLHLVVMSSSCWMVLAVEDLSWQESSLGLEFMV